MLSRVQLFVTPWAEARWVPLSVGFPRQGHQSGLHFLLQGIFLTQGSNLHFLYLLHCSWILYHLSHQGSPSGFYTIFKRYLAVLHYMREKESGKSH